ncbi:hypothetical protein UB46_39615 [Burkholderiaceae bacterium 16]|nr:hypothetical protein UB46_39615 [Burkholderiaceae bacterium 16]
MATKKNANKSPAVNSSAPSTKKSAGVPDPGVKDAVTAQIEELGAAELDRQVKLQALLQSLRDLDTTISGKPTDPPNVLLATMIEEVADVASAKRPLPDLGIVIADLDRLRSLVAAPVSAAVAQLLNGIGTQIQAVLNRRPDVQTVLDDLEALRHLRGGPADATAFHDFNVLQIAFKSVWQHAYDQNLQGIVEQLYLEHMKLYDDAGLQLPNFGTITDINDLMKFFQITPSSIAPPQDLMVANPAWDPSKPPLSSDPAVALFQKTLGLANTVPPLIPAIDLNLVLSTFQAGWIWDKLSAEQQYWVWEQAAIVNDPNRSEADKARARQIAVSILESPAGPASRIATLLYRLGQALAEPYAFDVFAPHSYNFGLMLTYRQKWEPGEYQAGDLVATLPLAPGEARKYTTRRVVRNTRAVKEVEKSLASSAYQSSESARAESEIMKRTTTATNFKMNADGSFNIGVGSIHSATEFATNQSAESAAVKKDFREATLKAAQEFRLERALEVDTSSSTETEQATSGEIANPNNEITVTYLFYELQRRYRISEILYRVRPVILVALDVPAPHQIDEAWLIQHQWIIARSLLDDSFRPALGYLNTGFAGDEISTEIRRRHWETQRDLVAKLEEVASVQLAARDELRNTLVATQLQKDTLPNMPGALKIFTMGIDPSDSAKDVFEANIKSLQTRLGYAEGALADAQEKLKQAASTFENATKEYTAALQNKFTRRVAIDQLRIHVKQNILYYMQAIWSQRVADQTFFELYRLPIACPEPSDAEFRPSRILGRLRLLEQAPTTVFNLNAALPQPSTTWKEHELIELADLDSPLGFKGNFVIFPMKQHCYLTLYMLQDFIDGFTNGLRDPDKLAYFLENFDRLWLDAQANGTTSVDGETFTPSQLKQRLAEYVSIGPRSTDEIIVPTGQLFIEALPGSHPVLEDFKLLHRVEDVRKVKAEVRHSELENLRLAARVLAGQLRDPDIEKNVLIEGGADVTVSDV